MLCRNPFVQGVRAYPCGQCMPCRFNRRRIWTHRLLLEQLQHGDSAFATLTYDDAHLPPDLSLRPKDVQDWLKRLRKAISPLKLRYYVVGEYGDSTFRPHYHAALFGLPSCRYGVSRYSRSRTQCCGPCELVRASWSFGHVVLGTLERHSAQYIAGYVTKKLTSKDDPRLGGRHPEFARMSLRPGLGHGALHDVASTLLSLDLEKSEPDVPSALRHGSSQLPLGRYLRRKLRLLVGHDEACPASELEKLEEEVRPLYEAACAVAPNLETRNAVVRDALVEASRQRFGSFEAKSRIYKKRGTL